MPVICVPSARPVPVRNWPTKMFDGFLSEEGFRKTVVAPLAAVLFSRKFCAAVASVKERLASKVAPFIAALIVMPAPIGTVTASERVRELFEIDEPAPKAAVVFFERVMVFPDLLEMIVPSSIPLPETSIPLVNEFAFEVRVSVVAPLTAALMLPVMLVVLAVVPTAMPVPEILTGIDGSVLTKPTRELT